MKSDLSRNTFDPAKHFSRVLLQQGRVTLDADWNEQADILLHYLRVLAADLIGPHGGPEPEPGFRIWDPAKLPKDVAERLTQLNVLPLKEQSDWLVGPGRYYVDGFLCENDKYVSLLNQPDLPLDKEGTKTLLSGKDAVVVYLDVWERNITSLEDPGTREVPGIREVALNGPDTAARTQVVWQVKARRLSDFKPPASRSCVDVDNVWKDWIEVLDPTPRGRLQARVPEQGVPTDPCLASSESRYRGVENQLYRVEIHYAGEAALPGKGADPGKAGESGKMATFKWSRENGSVVFPILKIEPGENKNQTKVRLAHLGRDAKLGLKQGDWVEIVNDEYALLNAAARLLKVHSINPDTVTVTLEGTTTLSASGHPLLRRWDQRETELVKLHDGVVPIKEDQWQDLEDGVQVRFAKPTTAQYRTGDYWLIPARVATGDIEWPQQKVSAQNEDAEKKQTWEPVPQPPHGVDHHYAPLAILALDANPTKVIDLRHEFDQRAACIRP